MERFQGHFYKVTSHNRDDTICRHFNSSNHQGLDDFLIHIVEFINNTPDSDLALQKRLLAESN
jgi:hypothetical protein